MSSVAALFHPVRHLTANFGTSTTQTIQEWVCIGSFSCAVLMPPSPTQIQQLLLLLLSLILLLLLLLTMTKCLKTKAIITILLYHEPNFLRNSISSSLFFCCLFFYKKDKHSNTPIFNIIKIQHHNPPTKD